MATDKTVIRVAWRTPALKATSFFYFHRACYAGSSLPNQKISELDIADIGYNAVCCRCWRKIKDNQ
jgi:hypothetical protein